MSKFRAKLQVSHVTLHPGGETVKMHAVSKSSAYPEDGSDEDNSYAKFSPSANLELHIANPALFGTIKPGQKFYVDFTEVEAPAVAAS